MGIWDPVLYGDAGSGACGSWGLGVQIWGICTPVVGVSGSISWAVGDPVVKT